MPVPLLPAFVLSVSLVFPARSDAHQAAVSQSSQSSETIRQAELLLEHGDYKAAEPLLTQLAAANPKDAHILYDLGFAAERIDHDTEAAKAYEAALALDTAMTEARVALGLLHARHNEAAEARRNLRTAADTINAAPDLRARSLRALAEIEAADASNPDPGAAREDLLAAIRLTGEQPSDTLLSARLAERAGDSAGAEAAYRRTLASTPADPDAVSGLAHALSRRGHTAEAIALLEDASRPHPSETSPADPRLASQLAALYAAQGPEGAAKAVTLLTELRKNSKLAVDPSLTRQLARLQLAAGNTAEAERLYLPLTSADPNDGPLLDDLGSLYVQQARYPEAEATLTRAVRLRSSFASANDWGEAAGHLAFAASRNHDPTAALQALAARATVLPNSAASLFLEAIAHDALHQNKDAVRAYKAFLTMAAGKLPDEEFQARHRIPALEHAK